MIADDVLLMISWLKWQKNQNYYFLQKHQLNHIFPMFFRVFRCFFRIQPSLTTISNVFFKCNHRNNFFLTISNYCNSLCKQWSSPILCPGLMYAYAPCTHAHKWEWTGHAHALHVDLHVPTHAHVHVCTCDFDHFYSCMYKPLYMLMDALSFKMWKKNWLKMATK